MGPKNFSLFVATLAIAILYCGDRAAAVEQVTVAVGSTVAGYLKSIKPEFEKQGAFRIDNIKEDGMGSDAALLALDMGKIDLAIIGSPLDDVLAVIKEKKAELKQLAQMKSQVLAWDKVIFIVSKGVPTQLNREQFKSILTGKFTNWKEAGGDDLAIQLVMQANTPATQKLISQKLLDGGELNHKGIKILPTYDEVVAFVGSHAGAVGFGPPAMKLGDAIRLKDPELTKPFVAVTNGSPSAKVQALMDFIVKNPPAK
jgi:phosphate transport system substrate-binding protein